MKIIIRFAVYAVAIFIAVYVLQGKGLNMTEPSVTNFVLLGLIFAVINTFLKPILKIVVGRVRQRRAIVRHPFINQDGNGGAGVVVGASGSWVKELLPVKNLAVGERAIGTVGGQTAVVDVIQHLRLVVEQAA